ncbi:MAG: hypothetical protein INQ03_10855 [Candidatus Heimdallarchaeota archaeon]|nr:hypothetical protein [Candidatus Heimdallarchaeota archaeon]
MKLDEITNRVERMIVKYSAEHMKIVATEYLDEDFYNRITDKQRRHFHAIIDDIHEFYGNEGVLNLYKDLWPHLVEEYGLEDRDFEVQDDEVEVSEELEEQETEEESEVLKIAEEKKKAAAAKIAEEKKKAEAAKIAEEKKKAEAAKKAEEKKKTEEEKAEIEEEAEEDEEHEELLIECTDEMHYYLADLGRDRSDEISCPSCDEFKSTEKINRRLKVYQVSKSTCFHEYLDAIDKGLQCPRCDYQS